MRGPFGKGSVRRAKNLTIGTLEEMAFLAGLSELIVHGMINAEGGELRFSEEFSEMIPEPPYYVVVAELRPA